MLTNEHYKQSHLVVTTRMWSCQEFTACTVTVLTQLPTHSFGMLQNQPKHGSLSNPLENQPALG